MVGPMARPTLDPPQVDPPRPAYPLPAALDVHPRLEQWIRIDDGGITLFTGKVELGQGILTALTQIAADELDVPLELVRVVSATTEQTPDEGFTAGSFTIETTGRIFRTVAAHGFALLAAEARRALGEADVAPTGDGSFTGSAGATVPYAALSAGIDWAQRVSTDIAPRDGAHRRHVGRAVPRVDLEDALASATFAHDFVLPSMLHARVVRPPTRTSRLEGLDIDVVSTLPGVVAVVRDGSFVAVCAEREEDAIAAAGLAARRATWSEGSSDSPSLSPREVVLGVDSIPIGGDHAGAESEPLEDPPYAASYSRPFIANGSIAPSCAVALFDDGNLAIWGHSGGVFALRSELAKALELDPDRITVHYLRGPGSYGHNGAEDAAYEAALIARALPGRPVRLLFSRAEEFAWAPAGPAMVVDVRAKLGPEGRVARWELAARSGPHANRPTQSSGVNFASASLVESGPSAGVPERTVGVGSNGLALYDFGSQAAEYRFLPRLPARSSSLRSLGGFLNVFAIESSMDDLAAQAGVDPVEFRLAHLNDPRGADVIRTAAAMAGWPEARSGAAGDRGLGLGFARYRNAAAYCAVVAEVEATDEIHLRRVWCAVDAGLAINPDGVVSQIEGGIVQGASWTLKEALDVGPDGVRTRSWEDYPILRFPEIPAIEVHLIDRSEEPSVGVGEAAPGPTAAAIGNAVVDALGIRVRDLPITRRALERAIAETD